MTLWRFRIGATFVLLVIGPYFVSSFTAEFMQASTPKSVFFGGGVPTIDQVKSIERVSAIAPLRSDFEAQYATAISVRALASPKLITSNDVDAHAVVRNALLLGPHNASLWLALALLKNGNKPDDPGVTEALKMSFLTGSSEHRTVLTRLSFVTQNPVEDLEVKELICSDVRTLLIEDSDAIAEIVARYAKATASGKFLLESCAGSVDTRIVERLRAMK